MAKVQDPIKRQKLYDYLSSQKMTDLSFEDFSKEYGTNNEKQSNLFSYLKTKGLTDLDEESFSSEYFGDVKKKEKASDSVSTSQSRELDSERGVGSLGLPEKPESKKNAVDTDGKPFLTLPEEPEWNRSSRPSDDVIADIDTYIAGNRVGSVDPYKVTEEIAESNMSQKVQDAYADLRKVKLSKLEQIKILNSNKTDEEKQQEYYDALAEKQSKVFKDHKLNKEDREQLSHLLSLDKEQEEMRYKSLEKQIVKAEQDMNTTMSSIETIDKELSRMQKSLDDETISGYLKNHEKLIKDVSELDKQLESVLAAYDKTDDKETADNLIENYNSLLERRNSYVDQAQELEGQIKEYSKNSGLQEFNDLLNERNALAESIQGNFETYNNLFSDIQNSGYQLGTIEQEIDFAKRNYSRLYNTGIRTFLGFANTGQGVATEWMKRNQLQSINILKSDAERLKKLLRKDFENEEGLSSASKHFVDQLSERYGSSFSITGLTPDNYEQVIDNYRRIEEDKIDKKYLDFVDRANAVDEYHRSKLRPEIEVSKIKNLKDAVDYSIDGLAENVSTLLTLAAGGAGELTFLGSHFANLRGEYETDRARGNNDYSDGQIYWASAVMSVSELAFHKYVGIGRQVGLFKRAIKAGGERELKRNVGFSAQKLLTDTGKGGLEVGKSVGAGILEGASIALTHNLAKDFILGEENVDYSEGIIDQAGGYVSLNLMLSSSRLLGGKMIGMVTDNNRRNKVASNMRQVLNLEQALEANKSEFSEDVRKTFQDKINSLLDENNDIIKQVTDGFDGLAPSEQKEALETSNRILALDIMMDKKSKEGDRVTSELQAQRQELDVKRGEMLTKSKENMDKFEALSPEERLRFEELAAMILVQSSRSKGIRNYDFNEYQIRQVALQIFASGRVDGISPESVEIASKAVDSYELSKSHYDVVESIDETIERLSKQLEGLKGGERSNEASRIADVHAESYREFLTNKGEEFTDSDILEYRNEIAKELGGEARTEINTEVEVKTETDIETDTTDEIEREEKVETETEEQKPPKEAVEREEKGKEEKAEKTEEELDKELEELINVAPEEKSDFDTILESERKKLADLEKKHGEKHDRTREQRAVVDALEKNAPVSVAFKNGKTVVKGRGSDNPRTRREAVKNEIDKGLYEGLPETDLEGVPMDRAGEHIADHSTNPVEVAEALEHERSSKEDEARSVEGSVDDAIAFALGAGVKPKSYQDHTGLKGRDRADGLTQSYIRQNGLPLDMIAMQAEIDVYGDYNAENPRVTTDMVVDFMHRFPSLSEFNNSQNKTNAEIALESKFTELTGLHPNQANIDMVRKGKKQSSDSGKKVTPSKKSKAETSKKAKSESAEDSEFKKWFDRNGGEDVFGSEQEARAEYDTLSQSERDNYVPFSRGQESKNTIPKNVFDKLIDRLVKAFPKMGKKGMIFSDKATLDAKMKEFGKSDPIKDGSDEAYGALFPDGSMYLDSAKMNANTPIHEFGHLWARVLKQQFPMAHKKLMTAVKRDTKAMDEVRNDPAYQHLKTDDQIADEVLARYIGDKGEQKFLKEQGLTDKERSIRQRIIDEVQRIWNGIKKYLGETNKDIRKWSDAQWDKVTLGELTEVITGELLGGKDIEGKNRIFESLPKEVQEHIAFSYGSKEAFEQNVSEVSDQIRESQLKIDFDNAGKKGTSAIKWEKQYKLDFSNPVQQRSGRDTSSERGERVLPEGRHRTNEEVQRPDRTVHTVHGELRERTLLEGFQESGYVDIVGVKVNSPQDIADLFLIHRSPFIEKGHVVYIKDGKIIKTSAETLGLPAGTTLDRHKVSPDIAKRLGADKIVFVHNHPSGNPNPSNTDIQCTKMFSKLYGNDIEFEHIVIDSNKFTLINRDGTHSLQEYKNKPKPFFTKRIDLVEGGNPPQKMMDVATQLSKGGAPNAVIYLSHKLEITGYDIIDGTENLSKYIKDNATLQGATRFAIVSDGKNPAIENFAKKGAQGFLTHIKIDGDKKIDLIKDQGHLNNDQGTFKKLWEQSEDYKPLSKEQQSQGEKFLNLLDEWEGKLNRFGRETLGMNLPAVLAKGMIRMMRVSVKAGMNISQAFEAGMDYIRNSEWYQKLSEADRVKIESGKNHFKTAITNAVREAIESEKKLNKIREKLSELKKSEREAKKSGEKLTNAKERANREKEIRKEVVDDLVQFLSEYKIEGKITPTEVNRLIKYAARIATAGNPHTAFDKFVEMFEKTEVRAANRSNTQGRTSFDRLSITNEVDKMLANGMDPQDIIDSFEGRMERDIARDHLERQREVSDEEAYAEWKKQSKEYDKKVNKRSPVRDRPKKSVHLIRKLFFTSQRLTEDLLHKTGFRRTDNLRRNFHGAKGRAKTIFDDAYSKIYGVQSRGKNRSWALPKKMRNALNDIIFLRRVIEIEQNRKAKGLEPIMHSGGMNINKANAVLRQMESEFGSKKYNDLVRRSDIYFDTFKKLLKDKYDAGMISEAAYNELANLNYSPRLLVSLLTDYDGDMSERGKANRKRANGGQTDAEIKRLAEGSLEDFFKNSEWLLASALNSGYRNIAQNRLNNMVFRELKSQRERFEKIEEKIKNGDKLRRSEQEFYDAYKELNDKIRDNPITGFNKNGDPVYKHRKAPHNFVETYRWEKGVKKSFFVEERLSQEWFAQREGFLNPEWKRWISYLTGSALVKYFATGNNPFFWISNTPRDLWYNYNFSDEYSPILPLGAAQLAKEISTAGVDIVKHDYGLGDNLLGTLLDYGLSMEFLSTQGRIKSNMVLDLLPKNYRDNINFVWRNMTFQQMQTANELLFRVALAQKTIRNFLKDHGIKNINEITNDLAVEKGYESKQDMLDDMYESAVSEARGILDFSRGGMLSKDLEAFLPYTNVAFQTSGKMLDQWRKKPLETFVKTAQVAGAMSVMPAMISLLVIGLRNRDEDDEKDKEKTSAELYFETIDGLSLYELTNYSHIPLGRRDENGNLMSVRIAKEHALTAPMAISDYFVRNFMRKQYGIKEEEKDALIGRLSFSLRKNYSTITSPSDIMEVPFVKFFATQATGYDFFREQYLPGTPGAVSFGKRSLRGEGLSNPNVEDFWKQIGEDYDLSPIRTKYAVESMVTSPSTNPLVGVLYGGADVVFSKDKDMDAIRSDLNKNLSNALTRRVLISSSDFNKNYAKKVKLEKKLEDQRLKTEKRNIAENKLINKLIDKEITLDEFNKEALELRPDDVKKIYQKYKSRIKSKDLDRTVLDLKYALTADERAIIVFDYYGDILDPSNRENLIELKKAGGIISKEFWKSYKRIKSQLELDDN